MRAVVVGAGVGGLAVAAGLGRSGWDVDVLERGARIGAVGAGLGIWPDAQHALDGVGVGPAFRAVAVEFGAASLFTASGRRLCAVPRAAVERRGGAPIRILPRSDLVDLLAVAVAERCMVHLSTRWEDCPDLLAGADLVVGADGITSGVRRAMFGPSTGPADLNYLAWRGTVDEELPDDVYGERWGDRCLVGLTRLAPGRSNFYVAAPAEVTDLVALRERLAMWADPVPQVLAAADPHGVLCHPVQQLRPHLASYVAGRRAVIGDAAHAMTPSLGRGACEAILDAAALVRHVGRGDAATTDVEAALRAWDRERRPVTQRVVDRSARAFAVATTRHPALRNAVVRALSPFVR